MAELFPEHQFLDKQSSNVFFAISMIFLHKIGNWPVLPKTMQYKRWKVSELGIIISL